MLIRKSRPRQLSPDEPIRHEASHKRPVTRRDFLAQGLAAGAMFICSIAILSHQFPEGRARARAFAAWGVVSGIGLGFGPVVGGAIIALTSWQWVFLVHVPLSLIALALIRAGVVESRDPQAQDQRLDWAGIATLTVAVLGLSWLITQGSSFGWTSPAALGLLAATLLVRTNEFAPLFRQIND